ncbi:LLM class flavin-dependent oxidoreductase [Leucobacter komagatae]|uniref:Luciferase n=1 Tax=Leucobacter komagatae TaxID=55969 RepID=A0A0D0ITG9_9MICO|nr:LLM class flavin-dependent oxidoreductase [Leucobacter komagatae]KIP52818.1 luciferase [Leucobacter komagatae]
MRLSVVDLGIVAPETSEKDALVDSVQFALAVERLGYHRIWFAEHHASTMGASHHPELLIAAVGALTSKIRVGSGAVLMNHYSPFKVAEMFKQLEAMYPGRVDLGMGRATAGPVLDLALQQNRITPANVEHTQQVAETVAWLTDDFPPEHPFSLTALLPSVAEIPHTWLLGSSPNGSNLAAGLGIGYTFAGFINPEGAAPALRHYRKRFTPGASGLAEPRAILAVNVTVGETADEAARLVSSPKAYYARVARGDFSTPVPAADDAVAELTVAERDQPTCIVDGVRPRLVAGSPAQVRATIEQMVEETGADEVMVQSMIPDPAERHRSHELLAEAFGITPVSVP